VHDTRRVSSHWESPAPYFVLRLTPQERIAGELALFAVLTTILTWILWRPTAPSGGDEVILLCLLAAVAGSNHLPVRIGQKTTIYFSSVPLYLLCCLFSPPIAAAATGLAMLTRELSVCKRCGNTPDLIASQVARWTLLSLGVSIVVHQWPADYVFYTGTLAAALLWAGDIATCIFIFPSRSSAGPVATMVAVARETYALELMQYLIALFVLMLLRSGSPWVLGIAYMPMILLSLLLLYLYLRSLDESEAPDETMDVERGGGQSALFHGADGLNAPVDETGERHDLR